MAEFSKLIITDKGKELIAKIMSGIGNIKFTKISTSDNQYTLKELEDLTSFSGIKQTSLISKITRTNEVSVKVEAAFNNSELAEGYYMRALGLYAVNFKYFLCEQHDAVVDEEIKVANHRIEALEREVHK